MQLISLLLSSEVIEEESTLYLQKALSHLQEIWEFIGIPEDQRLQRIQDVHKHIKVSLVPVSLQEDMGIKILKLLVFWYYLLLSIFSSLSSKLLWGNFLSGRTSWIK